MKVYLLNLVVCYKKRDDITRIGEVYSSLERAVEEGKCFLEETKKWKREGLAEVDDYDFCVTEVDLEYAENFEHSIEWETEDFFKREPTHIIYKFDADRKIGKKIS